MKKLLLASISVFALSATAVSYGQLLSDDFSTDGILTGTTPDLGGVWTTNSGTANQQNVTGGELFLNDDEGEDTRAAFTGPVTSGILTATFRLRIDTLDVPSSGNGDYITHFIGDTDALGTPGDFIGRVFTRSPAVVAAGAFRLGVSNSTATGTSAVYFGTDFAAGTNYNLTLSYNFGTATTTLSIAGFGSVVATDASAAITRITDYAFRQTSGSTGDQFIDNLIVVPEPSTYAMFVGGLGLVALVYRRKFTAA